MQMTGALRYRCSFLPSVMFTVTVLSLSMIFLCPTARAEQDFRAWRWRDQRTNSNADASETERKVLLQNGVERVYYIHVPTGLVGGRPLPLVFVFHGGDQGGALRFVSRTGFNAVADRVGFIVVYPEALPVWNDGRRTTANSPDDVAFIRSLIQDLLRTQNIDRKRIYATGASAGGIFTLRLACELSNQIAAFAPVVASFPSDYIGFCRPQRPISILMINGTDDSFVPWLGGAIRTGRDRGRGGDVIPVPETVAFWQRHNQCQQTPDIQSLPDIDRNDNTTVSVWTYFDCRQGNTVELVEVKGGGHTWPGSPVGGSFAKRLVGNTSYDINASDLIWQFFQKRSLP